MLFCIQEKLCNLFSLLLSLTFEIRKNNKYITIYNYIVFYYISKMYMRVYFESILNLFQTCFKPIINLFQIYLKPILNLPQTLYESETEYLTQNILVFSSLIFLVNKVIAFRYGYYFYSFLFLSLTITSILFHTYKNIYTFAIDKLVIFIIFLYGSYLLYQKFRMDKIRLVSFIVTTFLLTVYFFYYGYLTNSYCYDPDIMIGNCYHSLVHVIGAFGHQMIIFL